MRESKKERDGSRGEAAAAMEDKGFFFSFFLNAFLNSSAGCLGHTEGSSSSLMRLGYSPVFLPPAAFNGLKRFSPLWEKTFAAATSECAIARGCVCVSALTDDSLSVHTYTSKVK